MPVIIPLHALEPGQRARLVAAEDAQPVGRRLLDLGFVPGTIVAMVRRAPLGDPVEIELRGYRLCLRLAQLSGLVVCREDDAP